MSASVLGTSNYVRRSTPYLELESKGGERSGGSRLSQGVSPACVDCSCPKTAETDSIPAGMRIRFREPDTDSDIDWVGGKEERCTVLH